MEWVGGSLLRCWRGRVIISRLFRNTGSFYNIAETENWKNWNCGTYAHQPFDGTLTYLADVKIYNGKHFYGNCEWLLSTASTELFGMSTHVGFKFQSPQTLLSGLSS